MDVLSRGDIGGRKANNLVVAAYRLALSDRLRGDLVSSRDANRGCDPIRNRRISHRVARESRHYRRDEGKSPDGTWQYA